MQTLMDRLAAYCEKNEKPVPYGNRLTQIGHMVAMAVREAGLYEGVKKTTIEMQVNYYPEEAAQIIDDLIIRYFENPNTFVRQATSKGKSKIKYFNYDVEDYKAPAFEEALKKVGIEVCKNGVNKGKAQYRVPVNSPAMLVKLGKTFQKERWLQENQEKIKSPKRKRIPSSSSGTAAK